MNEDAVSMSEVADTVRPQSKPILRLSEAYDLLLLAALALLAVLLQPLPLPAIRIPLGLGLALFGPGYALMALVFPKRDDIDGITRAGLSFAMSIAQYPLLILALDKTPWGFPPWLLVRVLAAWIVLLCAAAVAVRWLCAVRGEAAIPLTPRGWWGQFTARERRVLLVGGLLGILLFGGGGIAVLNNRNAPPPSEFYMLGDKGLAQEYPREGVVGEALSVTIGIVNNEPTAHTYTVEVWVSDPRGAGRRERVALENAISLDAGQRLERVLPWSMPWVGPDQRVEILLLREDDPQPYRRLELWLDAK